jgi:hypothetical protein
MYLVVGDLPLIPPNLAVNPFAAFCSWVCVLKFEGKTGGTFKIAPSGLFTGCFPSNLDGHILHRGFRAWCRPVIRMEKAQGD